MNQFGALPKETVIEGQPHMLAYINPEEEKIIQYWLNFLKKYFKKSIKIYHWGNAEKVYLEYMMKKYPDIYIPNYEENKEYLDKLFGIGENGENGETAEADIDGKSISDRFRKVKW